MCVYLYQYLYLHLYLCICLSPSLSPFSSVFLENRNTASVADLRWFVLVSYSCQSPVKKSRGIMYFSYAFDVKYMVLSSAKNGI